MSDRLYSSHRGAKNCRGNPRTAVQKKREQRLEDLVREEPCDAFLTSVGDSLRQLAQPTSNGRPFFSNSKKRSFQENVKNRHSMAGETISPVDALKAPALKKSKLNDFPGKKRAVETDTMESLDKKNSTCQQLSSRSGLSNSACSDFADINVDGKSDCVTPVPKERVRQRCDSHNNPLETIDLSNEDSTQRKVSSKEERRESGEATREMAENCENELFSPTANDQSTSFKVTRINNNNHRRSTGPNQKPQSQASIPAAAEQPQEKKSSSASWPKQLVNHLYKTTTRAFAGVKRLQNPQEAQKVNKPVPVIAGDSLRRDKKPPSKPSDEEPQREQKKKRWNGVEPISLEPKRWVRDDNKSGAGGNDGGDAPFSLSSDEEDSDRSPEMPSRRAIAEKSTADEDDRSSSNFRRSPRPKNKLKPKSPQIVEIVDDSDEENFVPKPWAAYDVARIVIGSKIFHSECRMEVHKFGKLVLQFRENKVRSTRRGWPGRHRTIELEIPHDIENILYFHQSGDSAEDEDEQYYGSFIALIIAPDAVPVLSEICNFYDQGKHSVLVEFREHPESDRLLEQIETSENESKLRFLERNCLKEGQEKEICKPLVEDSKKDQESRRRSFRSNASMPSSGAEETLLVYPFPGEQEEVENAAGGLRELQVLPVDDDDDDAETKQVAKAFHHAKSGRGHFLTIHTSDRLRLEPTEYLNDTLIDFWIKWISRGNSESVHIFSTHFFTALSDKGAEGVQNWTQKKGINIFSKKFIFFPINKTLHWSLAVAVNPGAIKNVVAPEQQSPKELEMDGDHPCILFFDSLKTHSKNIVADRIRTWLNAEWKRLETDDQDKEPFTKNTMRVHTPKVPYQDNGWDSGVFVCRYGFALYQMRHESFTRGTCLKDGGPADNFAALITKNQYFNFDGNDIARIREDMKTLIDRLSVLYKAWKVEADRKDKVEKQRLRELKRLVKLKKIEGLPDTAIFADRPRSSFAEDETESETKPAGVFASDDSYEENRQNGATDIEPTSSVNRDASDLSGMVEVVEKIAAVHLDESQRRTNNFQLEAPEQTLKEDACNSVYDASRESPFQEHSQSAKACLDPRDNPPVVGSEAATQSCHGFASQPKTHGVALHELGSPAQGCPNDEDEDAQLNSTCGDDSSTCGSEHSRTKDFPPTIPSIDVVQSTQACHSEVEPNSNPKHSDEMSSPPAHKKLSTPMSGLEGEECSC